jgi:nucleoside-diphosphate-sugar epimerase
VAVYCITGIAGFIGSTLARTLVERGETVRGIDDLSGGNLTNLDGYIERIDFIQGSIADPAAARKALHGADFVLHHAAVASVPLSVQDPRSTHETNVNGTLNVLIAARDAGVKRVIFAASSAAYGDQPTQPNTETMPPCPLSPYAVQKLAGEQYMQVFARTYGMPTVCLRYFNVFGPRQAADSPYSGVIAKFITTMMQGNAPQIFGDGNQTRDFTYVSNVVRANLLACEAGADSVFGRVINIGTGCAHTLNEMAATLAKIIGLDIPPTHSDNRPGDIRHSLASIELARNYLGYVPADDFSSGLRQTVEWYRSQQAVS